MVSRRAVIVGTAALGGGGTAHTARRRDFSQEQPSDNTEGNSDNSTDENGNADDEMQMK